MNYPLLSFGVLAGIGAAGFAGYHFGQSSVPESIPAWIDISSDSGDRFPFEKVMIETTGTRVLPLDTSNPAHQSLRETILSVAHQISEDLSQGDSPAQEKRRINEVSALFEEELRIRIDGLSDYSCQIPHTNEGDNQRAGYPDLRVEHLPSGTVSYLDPKLFEDSSRGSSLRTFYYEAKEENNKVTEDAIHLLLGFPHDGKNGEWSFSKPELVDLSKITLKLKVEFSASNKDLYVE